MSVIPEGPPRVTDVTVTYLDPEARALTHAMAIMVARGVTADPDQVFEVEGLCKRVETRLVNNRERLEAILDPGNLAIGDLGAGAFIGDLVIHQDFPDEVGVVVDGALHTFFDDQQVPYQVVTCHFKSGVGSRDVRKLRLVARHAQPVRTGAL